MHKNIPTDQSEYMNHSCEPNCWFEGDDKMTATRDIQIGEEICYEYATSESLGDSAHVPMKCLCGKPSCRGNISGEEYLDAKFQEKYNGHFSSYVVTKQQAQNK